MQRSMFAAHKDNKDNKDNKGKGVPHPGKDSGNSEQHQHESPRRGTKRPREPPTWFSALFGFHERGYADTQRLFRVEGTQLVSLANNKRYAVGHFSTPSLQELRGQGRQVCGEVRGRVRVSVVVGSVDRLHGERGSRFAVFQAASQFNCLEFVSPGVTPERGVTGYSGDHTQGPACAIACGAGTVYRNYLAPVPVPNGPPQQGQTAGHQLNNLADVNELLGNADGKYFRVKGGYTLAKSSGLEALNHRLDEVDEDDVMGRLRVGVHRDVQVTATNWGCKLVGNPKQLVTQVYGSACSISYSRNLPSLWERFACLVLKASYEATLWAAVVNAHSHGGREGSSVVFLTCLGGGVFGNSMRWIADAIDHALDAVGDVALDVRIVSYNPDIDPHIAALVRRRAA